MAAADNADTAQRSLAELRRILLANDVSGVRRLLYVGDLDWMRERLDPRDYFAIRDHINSGDMSWLRERFLISDARWLRAAVLERETDALRMMGRVGGLDWLSSIIPAAHFRELQEHLDVGDIDWVGERLAGWPLDEKPPPSPPTRTAASATAATVAPSPSSPPSGRSWRVLTFGVLALALFAVVLTSFALYDSYRTRDGTTPIQTTTVNAAAVGRASTSTTAPPSTTPSTSRPPATTLPILTTDVVYFPENVTYIPVSANAVLDTAVAKIKANPGITVRLNGVADPSGSPTANRLVSQHRAEAVQAALVARGAQAHFEIVATGTDATVEPALARRVEIVYLR